MLAYVLEQLDLLCCMSASLDLGLLEFIRPNVDKCDLRTHACFHHLTSVFLVIRSTQILSLFVRLLAAFGVQLLSVWKHTTSGLPVAAVLRASLLFFSRSPPVQNIALFPSSITCLQVTVTIPKEANIRYGDQAGILLYIGDSQWVKLVVEGAKHPSGARMIVLAHMPSNAHAVSQGAEPEACVCHKYESSLSLGSEAPKPVHLKLELRRSSGHCAVVASHRLDDKTHTNELELSPAFPFGRARFGVMAHLCKEQAPSPPEHWFCFSEFSGSA